MSVQKDPASSHVGPSRVDGDVRKVQKLGKHTLYEKVVYALDVLVPEEESDEIFVPSDSYLQQVQYGRNKRWRVLKNGYQELPPYLSDHIDFDEPYRVFVEKQGWWSPLDLGSQFLKRWDALSLLLLIFTAAVTPYETAFLHHESLVVDGLFLINRMVDIIFFIDMFVQMRTPYRDQNTGKLIRDTTTIAKKYLKGWFPIDLVSVLPFELLGFLASPSSSSSGSSNGSEGNSVDLAQLGLLRFLRLTRLLKLLRILRASRKSKQMQIHSNLRYGTVEFLKNIIIIFFLTHWIACGYRLVAEKIGPDDPKGWHDRYMESEFKEYNSPMDIYFASLYWAAGLISFTGTDNPILAPTILREWVYASAAKFIIIIAMVYLMANVTTMLALTSNLARSQDILVDNYLTMFDSLKLNQKLKFKVADHLTDHFATLKNERESAMLKQLPVSLHGFIALEMFLPFVIRIPYLDVFIERDPILIQEICRCIEIKTIAPNTFLFSEGYEGVYYLENGVVAIEGYVYKSGSVFGRTCLRENIKKNEGRALTDVQVFLLPRKALLDILDKRPKIKYYAKRWTAWQVLRRYILTYSRLYYTAAKRGAKMNPPLLSRRPNMVEGEMDDIDIAVEDHLQDTGF